MDKLISKIGPMIDIWNRLSPIQKATASMLCLLAAGALVAVVILASRPQYGILFSNLSPEDAGTIVEKLKENKVNYRITGGGSAIEVPYKDVYDQRLKLAGEGLPQGGNIGFEIFDKSSFGMTEFTQKLNYQRALQGELTKTIMEMEPISQARVHVVIPEESLYADKEKQSSASVVVKLRAGKQLNDDQVAAITHLVSAAVEGLKPANVAVIDTAGNLLSESESGTFSSSGLRLSTSQIQMQKEYEAQMGRDLQAMLERVLGPGKAVVRVNARMNFDAKQTESETYEPTTGNQGVLVSQEEMEESYEGGSRGMPGGVSLSPTLGGTGSAVTSAAASGDNYSRIQTQAKYQVSKRIEHITQAPGKVERISVAVLLDGKTTPTLTNTIREAVSTAVGFDASRGDQITVSSLPFDNTAMKEQEKEMEKVASRDMYMSVGKWAVAVLIGLGFLFFMRSFLSNWRPIEVTESYPEPLSVREMAAMELRSDDLAMPGHISGRSAMPGGKASPEDIAKLVKTWLAESES